jgi:RNA polymerase sigma-70 factor (ECF subfamily)
MRLTTVVINTNEVGLRMDQVPVVRATESFERFFRREYRAVLGLAIVLTGDVSSAEDLTQDAFLAALRQWNRVARMENPGAWVRQVVANRSVSRFRRVSAEARALLRLGRSIDNGQGLDLEARLDLWREVRRLPRRQAQVIALTYASGVSRNEVAQVLGCSEETVKTHLDRGREALSRRLPPPGGIKP